MVEIKKHSGIYTLKATQELPISLNEAWNFFSTPNNLEEITPNDLEFRTTSEVAEKAYVGQIITYKIGLLPGITTNWVTEITHIKEKEFFVDEQRFGPYAMWHHEHHYEALDNGHTLMTDKVSYKIPLGPLGHIAHALFVKKQLKHIFQFRYDTLTKKFN